MRAELEPATRPGPYPVHAIRPREWADEGVTMRRNKALSITALLGATVLGLTACSAGTAAPAAQETSAGAGAGGAADSGPADTTFKIAFNQGETHPQFVALDEMGDRIKERTEGRYDVEVFPNETLGAQRETIELVQSATIEMAMIGGPLLENFNTDFVVLNLPFLFESQEQQASFLNDPEVVGDLYSSLDEQNIHVMGGFHGGVRNLYNSQKPINTPADLAGMKIRIIESDTNIEMMRLMGGTGTPMGQGEVYTAIQSGVLDGAENNELIYSDLKHAEIAPYYSYTRHLMFPDYLIVNPGVFDGLSQEDQDVFTEELATAIEEADAGFVAQVETATESAEAAGAQFNEVEDADAFREAVAPLNESKLTSDLTREIYSKIQAAGE